VRECDGDTVTAAATPPLDATLLLQVARGAGRHVRSPCAHINREEAYPLIHSMETGEDTLLPAKYLGHWPGADRDDE
jgi:hypothetical protein